MDQFFSSACQPHDPQCAGTNHVPETICSARRAAAWRLSREYTPSSEPLSKNPPPGPSVSVRILSACSRLREGNACVGRYPGCGANFSTSSRSPAFWDTPRVLSLYATAFGLALVWNLHGVRKSGPTSIHLTQVPPKRLWFGLFPFDGRAHNLLVSCCFDCDGLLR
jgi:hypothetical protein